jgi:putative pyoverdin transport system ATP-binding/permease protein
VTLFGLFAKQAPNQVFLSMLLGTCAGLAYSLLIPLVLSSVSSLPDEAERDVENVRTLLGIEVSNFRFALLFGAICLFILVTRSVSQILLTRVALNATTELRTRTYQQILRAPVAQIEKLGPSRLLAAITADVARIVTGATMVPNVLIASVTLVAMLGYLLFLNTDIFVFVVAAIVFGVVTYQIPMIIGRRYFERGRAVLDDLQEAIRGLIYGVKELKLSQAKQDVYRRDVLLFSEHAVLRNTRRANTIIVGAANYGDLLTFIVVGVVAFVFISYRSITSESLAGAVMVLLYIAGPTALILNAIPQVMQARISLRRIRQTFSTLAAEAVSDVVAPLGEWRRIRVSDVTYRYDDGFTLGPIACEIAKGEITFIVGGNGSGKSTLAKVLALHYAPAEGSLWFGDVRIDRESLNGARQHVAAIFADYYLFDRLLTNVADIDKGLVDDYLRKLAIDGKVSVRDGVFSSIALSDGQKKRLALLVAFLEDRDLYIFDEWAADQDPTFKQVFYHEILQELKARNKAVVVISHDDRYFHVADQLLLMEDGRLLRSQRLKPEVSGGAGDALLPGDVACTT